MAEGLQHSSDFPNFETNPSPPTQGTTTDTGLPRNDRTALRQHAAELGAAAGKVVVMARQTKETLENLTQSAIYDRISDLAEIAVARAEQLQRAAAARTHELQEAAQLKAAELGRQAREKASDLAVRARENYYTAQRRAKQTVHDYPVQVAVAAGVVGFLLGVGLRIRRARRAY